MAARVGCDEVLMDNCDIGSIVNQPYRNTILCKHNNP